jgi:hypothetical protein
MLDNQSHCGKYRAEWQAGQEAFALLRWIGEAGLDLCDLGLPFIHCCFPALGLEEQRVGFYAISF